MADNNEQIRVLSNKEQAREKINVWHGSSSNWINMVKELTGNSLDIFNNNKLNHIQIILHNNNKIEYIDDANGIPVEGTASNGQPNYEAIFEVPFAGSKYSNSATVGCNGIFLFTLSATCEDIEYFIARPNKNIYNVSYHKGDKEKDFSIIGQSKETYSRLIFSLDTDVWDNPNFTFDEICNIVRGQSSLSNVKIIVQDIENNKYNEFYYANGILDYFSELTNDKIMITDNIRITKDIESIVEKNNEIDNMSIDLLFNFSNDSLDDIQKDFLNTADLIQHGTIQDGIILGLKNSIHKWLKDNGKYNKGEKNITLEDVSNGLNYICNVKSYQAEYVSQVKQQSLTPHYKPTLQHMIEEYMEIFFIENTIQSALICDQILINSRARLGADKTRQNIKNKLQGTKKGLKLDIEGLRDCDMKNSLLEERIFLVDEGLSANSTIADSFDNTIMGCLGLRGRFINSLKKTCSISDVLNNTPALGIIQAMGCGIEIPKSELKYFKDIDTFDIDNLRYGSIGLLCDSDAFGHGINLSILTFLYKYIPTLVKQGRVYIVMSPRFEIMDNKGRKYYVYNEAEKLKTIEEIGNKNIASIGIKKGLGEFDKDEFWDYVLSPEAREKSFIKVKYNEDEKEQIDYYFNMLMGDDIDNRKTFIKERIVNVDLSLLD